MICVSIIVGDISRGNGTERAVTNLANSLCKFGNYIVNIISCSSDATDYPYFKLNKTITLFHLGISLSQKTNYIILRKKIREICIANKTDFLLGTTHALNSVIASIRIKDLRLIGCEHMNYANTPIYSKIIRRMQYPKLDAVVLLTEKDRKHYRFCKNTFVIPNSVPQQNGASSCTNKTMLAVGRYTKQKGFDMLIQAFSLIHDNIPEWKLRIVGQGEDEPYLKKLIEMNGLEHSVILVPPTKNIAEEYLNAGMYVLSSRNEGFVLVLTEAKSFGLPSVSFNCPEGPADIIKDKIDGFLVEPENVVQLSEYMLKMATDSELRKNFGRLAKEDMKRLSPEVVFSMWDDLFKKVSN